jgi:purine catabolism regulator
MALTVREAMALGGLRRGEVLAGAEGLDRTITWVKVLESPETISWLAEGELLLTVAFAIKDDLAAQRDLMRNLAAVGSSGLVIKPERYLPQIPDDMLGQADEFGIPLIRIPPDVSYLEIMSPILERIINAQNSELRRSIEIHRQFTDLALNGQGLEAIVRTLGELVESSISLEDAGFHLLASHVVPGVTDRHRQQTLAHHGTPVKVQQAVKSMLQQVVEGQKPRKIEPIPEAGMTARRIIAPILAGRENLGYLSIIEHPEHHEELAMMAIEHAATVIALEMIKQREVAEAEDRVRGELVDDLLNGTFGDASNVQRRARYLHYDLSVPHLLLVVDVDNFRRVIRESRYPESRVIALKHQLFQVVTGAVRRGHPRHLATAHSDSIIVLVPQPNPADDGYADALAERIRQSVADADLGLTVSVAIGRRCLTPDDFKPAFIEAQRALDLMVRFGKREQVVNYDRLGVYRLLAQIDDRTGLEAFAGRMLEPLIAYDKARNTPLLKTLEVYLQRHGNLRQSARDLHIHLNTLHYRLQRIASLIGADLKDADVRLDLLLALRVRALAESPSPLRGGQGRGSE